MLLLLLACTYEQTRLADLQAREAWLEGADFTTGAVVGGVVSGDAVLFVRDSRDEVWGERVALGGPVLALGLELNIDPEWGDSIRLDLPVEGQTLPAEQLLGVYRGPAEAFGVGVGVSARQLRNRHGVSFDESHLAFGVGVMVALEWLRIAPGGSEDLSDDWDFSWRLVDSAPVDSPPDDSVPDDSTADDSVPDDSAPDDSPADDSAPDDSAPDDSPADDSPPTDTSSDRSSTGCGCSGGGSSSDSSSDPDTGPATVDSGSSSAGCEGSSGSSGSSGCSGSSSSSGCRGSGGLSCDPGGSVSCTTSPARGGLLAFVLSIVAIRRRR